MDAATQHPSDDEEIHDTSGTFAHTTVFFIFVVQKPSIINTFPLYFLVHWPTPSQLVKNPELQQMVEQFLGATAQDINLYYLIITTAKSMKEEEQNT